MASRLATATVAIALVCPAYADTRISVRREHEPIPALTVGNATDAKLDFARIELGIDGRAKLHVQLSTRAKIAHAGSVMIDVPRGARAHALAVTIAGARATAEMHEASEARQMFSRVIAGNQDPALLEHVSTRGDSERLALRVFPLVRGKPADVEIAIDMPEIERVAVEDSDGKRVVALARKSWMTEDPVARASVGETKSLFAGTPPVSVPIVYLCGVSSYHYNYGPDKRSIRGLIKLQIPRLRYCYMRQAQRDPSLQGTAELHFTIDPHGRTTDISIDGTLENDDVHQCLLDEVVTWTFSTGDGATKVNYPLDFRLSN